MQVARVFAFAPVSICILTLTDFVLISLLIHARVGILTQVQRVGDQHSHA